MALLLLPPRHFFGPARHLSKQQFTFHTSTSLFRTGTSLLAWKHQTEGVFQWEEGEGGAYVYVCIED